MVKEKHAKTNVSLVDDNLPRQEQAWFDHQRQVAEERSIHRGEDRHLRETISGNNTASGFRCSVYPAGYCVERECSPPQMSSIHFCLANFEN